jgi:glycosyltransferase involved in cell wall biosynthesis
VDRTSSTHAFRSEAYRARLRGGPANDLLVTYIGRIAREKNLELLLRAWEALVGSRGRGAAGAGRVGGPWRTRSARRELPGVHVTGLMKGRELAEAYASADLFTFPSPTETFGNSLLEAMGSGLPSLVAAAGGVLEFAEHGGQCVAGARRTAPRGSPTGWAGSWR